MQQQGPGPAGRSRPDYATRAHLNTVHRLILNRLTAANAA